MNDSQRAAQVVAAGQIFEQYGGARIAREVIASGGDLADFHRRLAPQVRAERDLDRAAGLSLDEKAIREFSISRLARTLMGAAQAHGAPLPDPFDRNKDTERLLALAARGASCPEQEIAGSRLPWAVLTRDFSTAQSGAFIPTALGTGYTGDALREALPLARLDALTPVMKGTAFSVPVIASDTTNVAFLGEVAAIPEGNPTTGLVTFTPKRVGAYVEVSRQALIQGGGAIDSVLSRIIFGKIKSVIEAAAINGDGTGDNPLGIRSTPNINTIAGGTDGAVLSWAHITDLEHGPAVANAPEAATGYLINAGTRRFLKRTPKASGLPIMWDGGDTPLNGHRAEVSNLVPGNLEKGASGAVCQSLIYSSDWSMLLLPIFGSVELTVDPYSKADAGNVRLICNVYMSAGVLQPSCFCLMDDAKLS